MALGYFTDSTPLTPLRDPFNVLVDGINANEAALSSATGVRQIQTFRWADSTARGAQTGMIAGDRGYQTDTAVEYIYNGSAWVADPLDTGWINATYSGAWGTSNSMPVRYRRLDGVVYVEGEATGGTAASTIFTLPAGFQPAIQLKRAVVNADGTAYYRAIIATNGNVSVSNAGSSATPNLAFSFIADQ